MSPRHARVFYRGSDRGVGNGDIARARWWVGGQGVGLEGGDEGGGCRGELPLSQEVAPAGEADGGRSPRQQARCTHRELCFEELRVASHTKIGGLAKFQSSWEDRQFC